MSDAPDAAVQIANLPFALILLRPGMRIAATNSAAQQLLGKGARILNGKPLEEVVDLGNPRLLAMMSRGDMHLSARDLTVRFGARKSGSLTVFAAPVPGWPGWQTITLFERAEVEALHGGELPDGDDAVLGAPAILAHEIKNPLAGIRGAAQLIARKLDDGDRAMATLIIDEVDRIAGLIDQMQSLGRKSADPVAPVNPHLAMRRARAVLEAGGKQPVSIVEDFDPSLPDTLVSSDALMQVVLNLITNAVEACAASAQPQVVLASRFVSGITLRAARDGQRLALPIELRISDNGPGIDAKMRDRIFDPFVSTKQHGQGLGLALVRKLVRDMHGRITLERDDAAGMTHFRLHLPMAQPETADTVRHDAEHTA